MPIYEYKCKKCGQKFEVRLGFSHDPKQVKCSKCGGEGPERVFSPFATGSAGSSSAGGSCSTSGFK